MSQRKLKLYEIASFARGRGQILRKQVIASSHKEAKSFGVGYTTSRLLRDLEFRKGCDADVTQCAQK